MSSDIAMIDIVNTIREMTAPKKTNNMIFGEVKSIDPLKIDIGNNIVLSEKFLYLGQMCRPHKVTIPHKHLINAIESGKTKAITTTAISAGVATNVPQKTGTYDVKTQEVKRNDDEGTNERTLKTETKSGIDLGGATLSMSIDVTGSITTGTSPSGATSGAVTKTTDLSTFTPSDSGHEHIIPEHETQDVHFPNTDYEDSVEIEMYPRLKVGDIVLMFAMNDNQLYYVAERVEGE